MAVDQNCASNDASSHPRGAGRPVRRIAILGGGTAGWLAASMLARALTGTGTAITVVESPQIGTVGVGEATIPPILDVLRFLGIDEADFALHTSATYKLGIRFTDWRRTGHSYWHPFGTLGAPINRRPFFHAWQRASAMGMEPKLHDYSICTALAEQGRFRRPDPEGGAAAGIRYAFHFDAALVAEYLAAYAGGLGVVRWMGTVVDVRQRADGLLETLVLEDGRTLAADLFLDCSGLRGALIEQVLKAGYEDWRGVLPCDRAVAIQTPLTGPRNPYTDSIAMEAGWRWKIPLRNRVGNGYVYASPFIDDESALDALRTQIGEAALREPRVIRFTPGRRRVFWERNCIALGLASGFLEPLESTSIHLVYSGVYHLLEHFPDCDFLASNIAAYNRSAIEEFERIRDFIVLHYCLTERDDAPLWRYCRTMALPDSLAERIATYRETGRIRPRAGELFTDTSWFYVLEGMGVRPQCYDPLLDVVPADRLRALLDRLSSEVALAALKARSHDSWFTREPAPRVAVAARS